MKVEKKQHIMYHSPFLLAATAICLGVCTVETSAFAVSSSQSPRKRKLTNQSKGAGGFGKKGDAVPTTHTRDTSDEINGLVTFLTKWKSVGLGMDSNAGTEVGYSTLHGRRGMYATKSFKKGDILCKIPSDCALALSDPSRMGDLDQTPAEGGRNFLQWYANNDKARAMWEPYLASLPTEDVNFDPTPDFYSDEEIDALEYPLAIRLAAERRMQSADLSEKEGIPLDELQFATWLIASRSFVISISIGDEGAAGAGATAANKKALRVLLPYLDMINHSSDNANAELHLIDPEKDEAWFAIRATRPIKAGKEISIAYGSGVESSVELLQNYGFVPEENRIDTLMLKKGGEECIESLDEWSTTLEEDKKALEEGGDSLGNMANVLRLRIKLKESYP